VKETKSVRLPQCKRSIGGQIDRTGFVQLPDTPGDLSTTITSHIDGLSITRRGREALGLFAGGSRRLDLLGGLLERLYRVGLELVQGGGFILALGNVAVPGFCDENSLDAFAVVGCDLSSIDGLEKPDSANLLAANSRSFATKPWTLSGSIFFPFDHQSVPLLLRK